MKLHYLAEDVFLLLGVMGEVIQYEVEEGGQHNSLVTVSDQEQSSRMILCISWS